MSEIIASGGAVILVDEQDAVAASGFSWWFNPSGPESGNYPKTAAIKGGKRVTLYLHRLIADRMGLSGAEVDHIDGNRLNCHRSNLRGCSRSENERNKPGSGSTKVRGVCWDSGEQKWLAEVYLHGKRVWKKRFDDMAVAVNERDAAAVRIHGEFAFVNRKAP